MVLNLGALTQSSLTSLSCLCCLSSRSSLTRTEWEVLNWIAHCENKLDNHCAAEEIYNRVRSSQEASLGPQHPATLKTMNHLAGIYKLTGRLDESRAMYESVLEGRRIKLSGQELSFSGILGRNVSDGF